DAGLLDDAFAVKTDIEALAFLLIGDTEADREIEDLENDEAPHAAEDERGHDRADLHQHVGIGAADFLDVEHTRQQRADDAAYAVNPERIERIEIGRAH